MMVQAERAQGAPHRLRMADLGANLLHRQSTGLVFGWDDGGMMPRPLPSNYWIATHRQPSCLALYAIWSRSTPRSRAICRAETRLPSPCIVARTMLWGLVDPRLLVRISVMPAHSSTARTGPPAITPVPVAAG